MGIKMGVTGLLLEIIFKKWFPWQCSEIEKSHKIGCCGTYII
jgi:hypothetical protein